MYASLSLVPQASPLHFFPPLRRSLGYEAMLLCHFVSSLQDESAATAAASSSMEQYLQRLWACPVCGLKLAVTMAEQLLHQANCTKTTGGWYIPVG